MRKIFAPLSPFFAAICALSLIPTLGFAASVDSDGDGVNDYREGKDGTDPSNANSFNPLSKGLVLYYQLDGNKLDSSGHVNDLTNSTSGFAFTTDRFGAPSSAAYFTGPNDGADSKKSLGITGNQSRTISFWFKATNSGAFFHMGNRVVETEPDRATAFGIIANVSQTNTIFYAWGNWADAWTEEVIIPEGASQWRHLVYSYAGNKVGDAKLYIDGRLLVFTQSSDAEFKTIDGPIALGQNFLGPIFSRTIADSSLDEFRVYNRALSPTEVNQLYQTEAHNLDPDNDGVNNYRENKDGTDPNDPTSFNPLSKGLVLYYPFDGNANDESGNSNNIVAVGLVTASFDRFGRSGKSFAFTKESGFISERNSTLVGNTSLTLSVWMQPENEPQYPTGHLLRLGDGPSQGSFVALTYCPYFLQTPLDGSITLNLAADQNYAGGWATTESTEFAGKWSQVVATYDSPLGLWSFYIDGKLQTNASSTNTDLHNLVDSPLYINGAFSYSADPVFPRRGLDGSLDDIRVYNRALSHNEIKQLYYVEGFTSEQNHFVTSNPSILGHYSLSEYNANRTNGRADVTTNPSAFNLFTQSQFDANRTAGQSDVINNPMSYGLYTSDSIMDLRMGGLMIQRIGTNAVVSFQPQTTTDLNLPFTNNGTPITNTIPMPGNKGFIRINAKP